MRKKRLFTIIVALMVCFMLTFTATATPFTDGNDTDQGSSYGTSFNPKTRTVTLKKGKTISYRVIMGEQVRMKVSGKGYKWTSSNNGRMFVDQTGFALAATKGTVTVTAKKGKTVYKCKFIIENPNWGTTIGSLNVGSSFQLKVSGTKQKIKWKSSNTSVLTVNSNGKITGKKAGQATVTATVSSISFTLSVTVKAVTPPVPTPTPTPTAKTYGKNQTWRVPGQWEFTVNRVYEISERNPYSSIIPAQVMMIEYTYKNLGYQNKWATGYTLLRQYMGSSLTARDFREALIREA